MRILFTLLFTSVFQVTFSQTGPYSRIKIYADSKELQQLSAAGIAIDHGQIKKESWIISDFSLEEKQIIKNSGLQYEVVISDVQEFYINQNKKTTKDENKRLPSTCGSPASEIITPFNFNLGSMGGYYTYQEMLDQLDLMASLFPDLITVKQGISNNTSYEGRPIYWVRISDNPTVDENEPEMLYNALHHAREAASMQQLIFYMYYLLENYTTNSEIKYLVDNTELYFIPCVNPDGYIYNESTNPDGGGMWRKNRRDMSGNYGVDLNRNYDNHFAHDDNGSSPNPGAETYRGAAGFSEPETQAMRDFCNEHNFKIALNYHTYGNLLVYPWSYEPSIYTPDSALFVDYAKLLTSENFYTFGTANETVGYTTNGDSDDWMYGEQTSKGKIFAFTPEAGEGSDGFWPPDYKIEGICKENIRQNLYAAQLLTPLARVNDLSPAVLNSVSFNSKFNIQRLGLDSSGSFTVSITPVDSWIVSVGNSKTFANMQLMEQKIDSIELTLNSSIQNGQRFSYVLTVANGNFQKNDTIVKIYGQPSVVFATAGDNLSGWTNFGWGTSSSQFYSPDYSITDSPTGNYPNNANKTLTLSNTVSLQNAASAHLTFFAKWNLEAGYDFVQVQASSDGGANWQSLCGKYTKPGTDDQDPGNPLFDGNQNTWVQEHIDLNNFLGEEIIIRFKLKSDGWVSYDGFYFDDLSIELMESPSSVATKQSITLNCFPNPTSDYAHISYNLEGSMDKAVLKVFNSVGGQVLNESINTSGNQIKIDLKDFSSGVYFYKIETSNRSSATRKLIVIK